MIRLKQIIQEAKANPKSWKTGYDIIEYLDSVPQFKKYRVKNAQYDDLYFKIPSDLFQKITGLGEREIDKIQDTLEPYEGSIYWNGSDDKVHPNTVTVYGGS